MALPLVAELNRRRVFRALILYGVVAFAVLQIAEPVMHGMHWPDSVLSYIVVLLAFGFPVVVGLAWVFDVKASGVERSASGAAARTLRGAPLALALAGIGALAAAPGLSWYFFVRGRAMTATDAPAPAKPTAQATPSIAVLPFADMSPQKDQDYLSDGIAEEILNSLAQIEGLRVIGRTSSFSFKGKNEDLRGIGEKLGATNLLEGSVRKSGARIRITAQLVDAARGSHLWSQAYDRDLTDIFAVQDEIAKAVVAALTPKLLERGSGGQERRTSNPEAYRLYLLGRQFENRGSVDGNRRAIEAYQKAIALDPDYARAWMRFAWAQGWRSDLAESVAGHMEMTDRALAAADKTLALDPTAEGFTIRGTLRYNLKWDWTGARADYESALARDRNNPRALAQYHALLVRIGGLHSSEALVVRQKAIAVLRKAIELDPLNPDDWSLLAYKYWYGDQFDLARGAFSRALELAPESDVFPCRLAALSLDEGRPAAALDEYTRCPVTQVRLWGNAIAHYRLGQREESQKELDSLIANYSAIDAYQIAEVYAVRNDKDRAFEWLQRGYEQHDGGLGMLKWDRFMGTLRDDPRYKAMLRKINLPVE
jgi:TolB-like protein